MRWAAEAVLSAAAFCAVIPAWAQSRVGGGQVPVCREGRVELIVGGEKPSCEGRKSSAAPAAARMESVHRHELDDERRSILRHELEQERSALEREQARGSADGTRRARENVAALEREIARLP